MLRFIWVYYHEHNEDIPPYKTVWENGTIDPNVGIHDESDFMQESFVVWPGNVWHKCVTLKFPHEWNLGTQTHVSITYLSYFKKNYVKNRIFNYFYKKKSIIFLGVNAFQLYINRSIDDSIS